MGKFEMAMEAMNRVSKMGENLPKEDMLKGLGAIAVAGVWVGLGLLCYQSGDHAMGYIRDIVCSSAK